MSLVLGDPRDSDLDILNHADSAGKLQLKCTKCTAGAVFFAVNMQVACDMANEAGWFLEDGKRMVCPACPGVRPKVDCREIVQEDGEKPH